MRLSSKLLPFPAVLSRRVAPRWHVSRRVGAVASRSRLGRRRNTPRTSRRRSPGPGGGLGSLGLLTREPFVAHDDHVAVERIEFHQKGPAAVLFGGDERTSAAAKEVKDVFAGT
jgi:hypothetical protein